MLSHYMYINLIYVCMYMCAYIYIYIYIVRVCVLKEKIKERLKNSGRHPVISVILSKIDHIIISFILHNF